MTPIPARLYDGASTRAQDVRVRFLPPASLWLEGSGGTRVFSLDTVRVSARLGETARVVTLPDGGRLEIGDNDAVDTALAALGRGKNGWLHRLERRWAMVAAAVAVTLFVVWGAAVHGIPMLAERAAHMLPPGLDAAISSQSMEVLDRALFTPSTLEETEQARLAELMQRVTADAPPAFGFGLEFRGGGLIGANAIALPSGVVVVTDELVALAEADAEILGVLAHEVGHVVARHALRQLLQNSATALLVATVTGDLTGAAGLAAALPTLFVESHYSREFEREADDYAADWMQSNGLDPAALGRILARMSDGEGGYLSTHPPTAERERALSGGMP